MSVTGRAVDAASAVTQKTAREKSMNEKRRARRLADDARGFAAGGAQEAQRLIAKTLVKGGRATAHEEVQHEKEYINGAESTFGKVLRAGQTGGQLVGVMLTITLAAAIGFVGTKVISEIDSSIETTSGTNYDNASNDISSGFADAMSLTDIVFLVLMFSVILGALLAFRAR